MTEPAAEPRLSLLARRHGIPLLAVALGTFLFATVMTEGTFALTQRGTHFTDFYDQLGRSLLHGRFDVPKEAIGLEAFEIGGRYYGYWGPTPALLRIPLDALFPSMWGRWTQLIMLWSCAATLLAVYALFRQAGAALGGWTGRTLREQYAAAAFVLAAAVGSSLFFTGRRPTIYHEAIALGAALALASFAWLASYLAAGKTRTLVLSVITALLANFARGSVGAGPLFALALLAGGMVLALVVRAARDKGPARALELADRTLRAFAVPRGTDLRKHALLLVTLLGLGAGAVAYRNIKTVGKLSGEPSFAQHVAMRNDPARLARTQGKVVHLSNLRTNLYNYFRPDGVVAHAPFPWFSPRDGSTARVFPEAHHDNAEPYASVTCVYTFWLALSLLGLFVAARPRPAPEDDGTARLRLAILGSALGALGPFIHVYISLRYLHDLFPLFVITGALGLQWLLARYDERRWVRAVMPFVVLLALYTCLTSVAITIATVRWT
jgi:hypothetical protein